MWEGVQQNEGVVSLQFLFSLPQFGWVSHHVSVCIVYVFYLVIYIGPLNLIQIESNMITSYDGT